MTLNEICKAIAANYFAKGGKKVTLAQLKEDVRLAREEARAARGAKNRGSKNEP